MFIERELKKMLPAPAERNVMAVETLRSAGARLVGLALVYKHSAPPEPGHCLVAAMLRCVICGIWGWHFTRASTDDT